LKTLVLTPQVRLLPVQGSVLFAGGWCLTPEVRRTVAERGLDVRVLPYHWDDRKKYYEDFLYLTSVYETYLETLSSWLNDLHQEKFDTEYWRLLAGPSLYTILCHLLDRWHIAKTILSDGGFDNTRWIDHSPFRFTPKLTIDLDPDCHEYNHFLIRAALVSLGMSRTYGERLDPEGSRNVGVKLASPQRVLFRPKQLFQRGLGALFRVLGLSRASRTFILNSYLPRAYDLLLQAICLSVPVKAQTDFEATSPVNAVQRELCRLETSPGDSFCQFASQLLPQLIPTYLVEDYKGLASSWERAQWPHAPRAVFTANAFQFNEVFQHYMATQRAKHGSKLIVGQHGGVSGILKWSFGTEHQIQISDKFVSWGWSSDDPKVVPGVVLTNFGKKISSLRDGCLLLTTVPMRRYSHKGGAWPVGSAQSQAFLEDQLDFYRHLLPGISGQSVLRIFEAQDRRFGSEYLSAWREKFPQVRVDDSKLPIRSALRKSRLFVYTYNSTGYLECLAMNFPTVMFWDTDLFETNDAFGAALGRLESVGIFHRSPESAATHVNRIWENIDHWWLSPDVQAAVDSFVGQFARPSKVRDLFFIKKLLSQTVSR
jgi:putative transferase (TIGR04331 family)